MTGLSWVCVLAVVVAAVLFGQTARGLAVPAGDRRRHRAGVVLSISGPVLALAVGVAVAVISGAWLTVAAGTVAATLLTAVAGASLAP